MKHVNQGMPRGTEPKKYLYNGKYYSQRDLRKWYNLQTADIKALPAETHTKLYIMKRAKAITLPPEQEITNVQD